MLTPEPRTPEPTRTGDTDDTLVVVQYLRDVRSREKTFSPRLYPEGSSLPIPVPYSFLGPGSGPGRSGTIRVSSLVDEGW